jgi:beta-mannosidase
VTGDLHDVAATALLAPGVGAGALQHEIAIEHGWELARVAPDAAGSPVELEALPTTAWRPALVPGTVAMADRDAAKGLELDAWDHWYRCRFSTTAREATARRVLLCLDGLATLADVFLNGRLIARSHNMFAAQVLDVTSQLAAANELYIRFRALLPVLRARKPRGRWPTRLVTERNLRFVRTTLIGYMPGFCPTVRPVGPWRGVRLVVQRELAVEDVRLSARVDQGRGVLDVTVTCLALGDHGPPSRAELVVGGEGSVLAIEHDGSRRRLRGQLVIDDVTPWWPHTHGVPHTYEVRLQLDGAPTETAFDLGRVGFRTLERIGGDGSDFGLRVNGQPIFCRGACWMPLDLTALHAGEAAYREALEQVRSAGMNMLRLSGTMIYESDTFYRLCDELGILVWQDFMFANMDYPVEDPELAASCRQEATQLLQRLTGRACLAMLCGNSEASQQAAMMGVELGAIGNPLFDRVLPDLCAERRPDVPYVPSSPSAGALPFQTGPGPTHYYGVGPYLRPIDDARLRPVRFASECLAFAIPPEDETLRAWFGDEPVVVHHPEYKARVPRDRGVGWDFSDVTDHYVETLFGVPARQLRYADQERYLALSRVAAGEAMAAVQGLWRRRESGCHGALVWFLRDLWDGAGLGVVDSRGTPKAPYYYLRRAWAPLALWIVDEGTDGLALHAVNDRPEACAATLEVALYRKDGAVVERVERALELAARDELRLNVDELIGRFVDASYAYRFGPPVHTLVAARLLSPAAAGRLDVLARAFHLPLGLAHEPSGEVALAATARAHGDGSYAVIVTAQRFAQSVHVAAPGYRPSDDYFHLAPKERHELRLTALRGAGSLRGKVRALNTAEVATIVIEPGEGSS